MKGDMVCPKCKVTLYCPCKHCRKREKGKAFEPKWRWLKGDLIRCPECRYTDHCDNWM